MHVSITATDNLLYILQSAGIGAGAGGILVISFVCLLVYKQKKRKRTPSSSHQLKQTNSSRQILDLELNTAQYRTHIFSYEELEEATDGFNASKELGDGGFGRVYEGTNYLLSLFVQYGYLPFTRIKNSFKGFFVKSIQSLPSA